MDVVGVTAVGCVCVDVVPMCCCCGGGGGGGDLC